MRSVLILCLMLCYLPPVAAAEQVLAVVVAKNFPEKSISARELLLIYKKKLMFWNSGTRIHPVNLPADEAARKQFSLAVLKSLPEEQASYWNDMYYHGISPPHVMSSPEAVLRFVADTKGAIGYVQACAVDERVDAILWIDASTNISSSKPKLNCP
jgi:ABC-type phosphate transport system substrate-binding protein